jgi:para-aminobenzoate synthetase component 1
VDYQLKTPRQFPGSAAVAIELDGRDPIEALERFADLPHVCLLHSASPGHPLNRYSFLAADPVSVISEQAGAWLSVRARIRATIQRGRLPFPDLPPLQGGWMGWLGYELGTAFDHVDRHPCQPVPMHDIALGMYDWVIAWDHATGQTWLVSSGHDASGNADSSRAERRAGMAMERWRGAPTAPAATSPVIDPASVRADFTADSYQRAVGAAIGHVLAGDIFQVNLSQRFSVPFAGAPLALYREVGKRTPAPMAAYVEHDGVHVISASPERFLRLDPVTRHVETRPIKGTRPRRDDPEDDARLARELQASEKDQAENVMIVDLLRNDLARVCERGTVRVPVLNAVESHRTVHHLVSTVTGTLRASCDAFDLLAATFPGGSITGAPKLRAMSIIRDLEPVARGVYSGCIGWIGFDGGMDTSIAIRTVVLAEGMATFHAGGGITAQSDPADEYRETLDKARALAAAVTAT